MDQIRLALLREFADRGSVAEVARATHQTPSGVSQQLRRLENEAGLPLLEKRGRGLELTDAGRALVSTAIELATAQAHADAEWDRFRNNPAGLVRIASFPTGAEMLLPGLLKRIDHVPGLELECTDLDVDFDRFVELTADYDIVLAHTPILPRSTKSVLSIPLFREPLDVAVARSHRLASKRSVTLSDLRDEDWIGDPWQYFSSVSAQDATWEPRVRQSLSDIRVTEALVAAGLGVSLLPRYTASAAHRKRLVYKELRGVVAERQIVVLVRIDRAERLAVQTVIDLVRDEAEAVILADAQRRAR